MKAPLVLMAIASWRLLFAPIALAASSFVELGCLPGYGMHNNPTAMTYDGSTVVGWSIGPQSERAAYIWSNVSGISGLGSIIDGPIDDVTISGWSSRDTPTRRWIRARERRSAPAA